MHARDVSAQGLKTQLDFGVDLHQAAEGAAVAEAGGDYGSMAEGDAR